MADIVIPVFNEDAMTRIKRAVRVVEAGPSTGIPANAYGTGVTFFLAKSSSYVANDAIGTFTLLKAATTKGDETAGSDTVTAYVRRGIVLADYFYVLFPVCAGGDCHLEVLNPSTEIVGKTDASHAKSASGTISIYSGTIGSETDTSSNVTAYNRFADVSSGKWVRCSWDTWGVGGWEIVDAEC